MNEKEFIQRRLNQNGINIEKWEFVDKENAGNPKGEAQQIAEGIFNEGVKEGRRLELENLYDWILHQPILNLNSKGIFEKKIEKRLAELKR